MFDKSTAGTAGATRGWYVNKINNTVIDYSQSSIDLLNQIFFGSTTSASFEFVKPDGTTVTSDLSKTSFISNSVLHNSVIDAGGKKVGYFVFKQFFGAPSRTELNTVFSNFKSQGVNELIVDLRYKVVTGRNFSKDFVSDTAEAVVINQTFARAAGWKDPVGKQIDFFYLNKKYIVVGVIKDYHYLSLAEKIGPQIFTIDPRLAYRDVFIKLKSGNTSASLRHLERTFKSIFPALPYQYNFKDAQNIAQYEREAKWKQIITFGAILTIFISCIGLFGLATLSAEKRTKEIGIRKVLGASVAVIAGKLSADFLKLVLLASIIASPAAWLVMNKWLENYPYRIEVNYWMFAFAVIAVVLVALFTISFQAIKAAVANPVKSLRSE